MEVDPDCAHCGCELADGQGSERAACLVIDRLSCLVHVRIVRAYALRDSEQPVIEESVNPAEQNEIDAQAFWAEVAREAEFPGSDRYRNSDNEPETGIPVSAGEAVHQ